MNQRPEEQVRAAREKLLARAGELRDRLTRVRQDLRRERDPLPRDSDDAAIAMENDEVLQALEQSAAGELQRIQYALERLRDGTFARCASCGAAIDAERLQAVPDTTFCRDCAQ
jgi:DnaK suppressor protein